MASQPASAKGKGKAREPPPTLFLHPSPAASHVSLPGILAPGNPPQQQQQQQQQGQQQLQQQQQQPGTTASTANATAAAAASGVGAAAGGKLPAISSPLAMQSAQAGAAPATLQRGGSVRKAPDGSGAGGVSASSGARGAKDSTGAGGTALNTGQAAAAKPSQPVQASSQQQQLLVPPPLASGSAAAAAGGHGHPPLRHSASSRAAADRTDALWAEMQATLEEVELSATGSTRVFGPDHDGRLRELRRAQTALAQAWARSEADEAIETTNTTGGGGGGVGGLLGGAGIGDVRTALRDSGLAALVVGASGVAAATTGGVQGSVSGGLGGVGVGVGPSGSAASVSAGAGGGGGGDGGTMVSGMAGKGVAGDAGTDGGGSGAGGGARPGSSSGGGAAFQGDRVMLGAKLEEETEVDILLARKRREANDRYFDRVNRGLLDVVDKLEQVAVSMRAVEQESRDIWGDGAQAGASTLGLVDTNPPDAAPGADRFGAGGSLDPSAATAQAGPSGLKVR